MNQQISDKTIKSVEDTRKEYNKCYKDYGQIKRSKNSFDIEKCLAPGSKLLHGWRARGKNSFDIEKCLAHYRGSRS